jgi:hypothetical protein
MRYTRSDFINATKAIIQMAKGFCTGAAVLLVFLAVFGGIAYLALLNTWATIAGLCLLLAVAGFWICLDEARGERLVAERYDH